MNLRPSGYEPDELPGCSIPRLKELAEARTGESIDIEGQEVKPKNEKKREKGFKELDKRREGG